MTHYHLIGIGGTGLSAIAHVLLERGNVVSGSDNLLSPLAQELIDLGISVSIGHNENNITGADIIIRSSAIPDNNSEVKAALATGIPILKRRDFLSKLTAGSTVIAIAGTHGKTTTTAMVAWCLSSLGNDPSYVIGGSSKNLGNNAHAGRGKYFVIEADERNIWLGSSIIGNVITYTETPTLQIWIDWLLKTSYRNGSMEDVEFRLDHLFNSTRALSALVDAFEIPYDALANAIGTHKYAKLIGGNEKTWLRFYIERSAHPGTQFCVES